MTAEWNKITHPYSSFSIDRWSNQGIDNRAGLLIVWGKSEPRT